VTERPERARLFVALDLPAGVREGLAAWAAEATHGHEGLRLVDSEMLHVTLAFLGWRDLDEAPRIAELVLALAAPAAGLAVGAAVWLPPRRPRVLAVDLADGNGTLAEIQRRVAAAMAAEAGYEPERRGFRPHVTVARVRKGVRVKTAELPNPPAQAFAGAALTLYRSRLAREGARYEPLGRAEL
jgi:2'-5' RNA ligase